MKTGKSIAVVGTGYWGKNLVRNYHQLGALNTICDSNATALEKMAEMYPDVRLRASYEQILSDSSIKGVVIALPAELHFQFGEKALKAGKDVYIEKPIALELAHAKTLNKLADEGKRVLMVGHLLRYHPAFQKLKELVESGELGRIRYIYSNRLSFGKIRREENSLWSFAPHDISMILALCNEVPSEVSAVGACYLHETIADVTTTHISFPSGIRSHIFVSWLHPFKEQKLIVVADKKMAVFEDTQPWDRKIQIYPHSIKWENGMPIPQKAQAECVPVTEGEPLKSECEHFLECMASRRTPITDGQEGYRVLAVLDQAQKSLEKEKGVGTVPTKGNLPKADFFAHESAAVDEGSKVGKGTKVWHFSHVLKGATIGEHCILGQNVNVAADVKIGNNVKIQNNVSVYGGTIIEDDVFLGPSCVLTNVTNPRSQVVRHSIYEETIIRKGATIGANSTIVCGIEIGRYAFVAAGAVVAKNVPDYALMVGVPARQQGWMSRHGHRLGKPNSKGIMVCPETGFKYRLAKKGVLRCLDLGEERPLPKELATGTKAYDEFKETKPIRAKTKQSKKGGTKKIAKRKGR